MSRWSKRLHRCWSNLTDYIHATAHVQFQEAVSCATSRCHYTSIMAVFYRSDPMNDSFPDFGINTSTKLLPQKYVRRRGIWKLFLDK